MAGSPLGSGRKEYFRAKKSQSAKKRSKEWKMPELSSKSIMTE